MDRLVAQCYRGLGPVAQDLRRLAGTLDHLQGAGLAADDPALTSLRRTLRDFEPTVTMIGQVKAGKTSLINAMTGRPGLLPADINPWTSVVTSLHLSPTLPESAQKATFRFFSEEEWMTLLNKGGRVGELASRAGADKEMEKVRAQLQEMREKSRRRLGHKFEMLMGQTHDYGRVDPELIQRYVCLGDDFDTDPDGQTDQGRFADITKTADLHVRQPALALPLCIRDTPGVNDTFMVREQITVNAIRGSKLCVVVLSAHQALSTVDLALIRIIANIPSRDVIIFVNRVDELSDPVREIQEIRSSIIATLKDQNGPADCEVLFGSAHWADRALANDLGSLDQASADALIRLAEHEAQSGLCDNDARSMVWTLSGVPALGAAISRRIVGNEGARVAESVASQARNLAKALAASRDLSARRATGRDLKSVDADTLSAELDRLAVDIGQRLDAQFDGAIAEFETRLDGTRSTFLSRATASLIDHLETNGEGAVWTYNPDGLRVLLRSRYQSFSSRVVKTAQDAFSTCTGALQGLAEQAFQLSEGALQFEAPCVPEPPPPVILGQTIALDIKGGWWTRWWRKRRSYQAYANEFSALIDAEIAPMLSRLVTEHASVYKDEVKTEFRAFVAAQRAALLELAAQSTPGLAELREQQTEVATQKRACLDRALAELAAFERHDTARDGG